ncbi:DUF1360 domain-containing protein [Streptomyces smyrnaeus]|uniref:DUF1360 domain-containing protein n=1 Tax=Streptomyces smyrnaeus TaxID=1387713 RepID=UPI003695A6BB
MLNLPELALLAFAGYRGTQLLVHDSILDPVRDWLIGAKADEDAQGDQKPGAEETDTDDADAEVSTARAVIITLVTCVYCMGWWVAGALLLTWLLVTGTWSEAPLLVHGIEWLAVAGAAVLLNRWDDERKADG